MNLDINKKLEHLEYMDEEDVAKLAVKALEQGEDVVEYLAYMDEDDEEEGTMKAKYIVRKLKEADVPSIYEVMQGNPLFFQYCPPKATYQSIRDDMKALPPGRTYEDKYYIGFFDDNGLVAVMDLILHYPNPETAFVGFFMLKKEYQGKGAGTEIFMECSTELKSRGYRYIRLGFAEGNPQSEAFWLKNGFERTGVLDKQELYTVVVMEKTL